ncbi:MAG TPA: hypothetical protein VN025_04075 [Candidatus Dormibacteraeota bacterium]|jgi:hypothetical protein|nr:hypothetical protein [Candidatus Dormibacteraeota bacterium]
MPLTTQNASWDFNPSDTVTVTATFTFDLNDPSDSQTVGAVLTTLQGRTPHVTLAQTDNATITVTLTI